MHSVTNGRRCLFLAAHRPSACGNAYIAVVDNRLKRAAYHLSVVEFSEKLLCRI